jgi:uncharacterized protein
MIFVDADATPREVLAITRRVARAIHAEVVTVSSINHHIEGTNHVQVDAAREATDMEIVRRIDSERDTIVITQDYGLAALVLARRAHPISPSGLIFTGDNIDGLLAERAMKAKLRRSGKMKTKGPRPRTSEDDKRFEASLYSVIEKLNQGSPNERRVD